MTPQKLLLALTSFLLPLASILLFPQTTLAATYYIAPDTCDSHHTNCNPSIGNDSNPGTLSQPWKTFVNTWSKLNPGDTLILLNGVYLQTALPTKAGEPGNYIAIKAQTDGMAVIDGQFRQNALITDYRSPNYLYMLFEGINFRNGSHTTVQITSHYVTLKRFHAYNQFLSWNDFDPLLNSDPFHPVYVGGSINNPITNVLLEDCIASGYGTKMIKVFRTAGVTIRRCLTDWRWHGGHTDWNLWPWAGGLNVYHTGNNIFENAISLGNSNTYAINFHGLESGKDPNDPAQFDISNNKYLGSIALNSGFTNANEICTWPPYRPQPAGNSNPTFVWNYTWGGLRTGFNIGGNIKDTLFQDILAYSNAGLGFIRSYEGTNYSSNTRIVNSTFAGNHDQITSGHPSDGPLGTNVNLHGFQDDMSITNSYIQNSTYKGVGADITKRYVDGVKTSQDLWPWPMEQRVRDELGYSITNKISQMTSDLNSKGHLPYTIAPASDNPQFPLISTSTTSIIFDLVNTGSSNTKPLVVKNVGDATLIIDRFRLVDDFHENSFAITSTGTCAPTNHTLNPGQECALSVRFTRGNREYYTGRIAIYPKNMGQANHPEIVSLTFATGVLPSPSPSHSAPPTSAPTPTPHYSLDNDTDVDILDILILISRFTQNLTGDFNQNGRIDILDFNTLLKNRL